jgi:OOP family OmpA-OmpF porin
LILFFTVVLSMLQVTSSFANGDTPTKYRLPDVINAYQPTILPVISPCGTILYFDRKEHPEDMGGIYDSDDIWFSERIKDQIWSTPKNIGPPLNSVKSDALLSISADGMKALIYGEYDLKGNKNQGFSMVDMNNSAITTKIQPLKIQNFYNLSSNYTAQISHNFQHLLLSIQNKESKGQLDLYVSHWNEKEQFWSEPMSLGATVNTAEIETSPFLANDLKTLYFASSGHGGFGKLDIFVSRRLDETWQKWSKPVNIGSTINSFDDESSFSLTVNNDTLYFVSNDTLSLRQGIYVAPIPKEMQPEPFSVHTGSVKGIDCTNIETVHYNKYIHQLKTNEFASKTILIPFESIQNKSCKITFTTSIGTNQSFINTNDVGDFSTILPLEIQSPISLFYNNKLVDNYNLNKDFYAKKEPISFSFAPQKSFRCIIAAFYFESNSDSLFPNQRDELQSLAEYVQQYINSSILKSDLLRFSIVGHTDEKGNNKYNKQLSIKRANSVASLFQELLQNKCKIDNTGKGCDFPVEVSENLSNNKNRRVEIYLEYSLPNKEDKSSLR